MADGLCEDQSQKIYLIRGSYRLHAFFYFYPQFYFHTFYQNQNEKIRVMQKLAAKKIATSYSASIGVKNRNFERLNFLVIID